MKKSIVLIFCLALSWASFSQVADSIRVTLARAEEIFLQKNLLLLSRQYMIDAAKANEIQQKLYNNPVLSAELAAHGSNDKWFDAGNQGQKSFAIDQLISLAGKRNKRVLLAREETNAAGIAFYDVLRTLKYQLRQSFYAASYTAEIVQKYDEQMRLLQRIITSYDEQSSKGNVPVKDAVRLKSEYIQLSADRNSIIMESISAQQDLRLLLDTTAFIIPLKDSLPVQAAIPPVEELIEKAKANRTDLKLQESQLKQEQLNYTLQKALATPDLSIGAGYDQHGSYVNNLYTIRAGMELPFFNRNQGNIKAAKAQIKSAELVTDYMRNSIEKEVIGSVARLQEAEREYNESSRSFNQDFQAVNKGVIENFNRGNISILEFLDFFENYNAAIRQLNQLEKQRQLSREELEFTIGTKLDN